MKTKIEQKDDKVKVIYEYEGIDRRLSENPPPDDESCREEDRQLNRYPTYSAEELAGLWDKRCRVVRFGPGDYYLIRAEWIRALHYIDLFFADFLWKPKMASSVRHCCIVTGQPGIGKLSSVCVFFLY
jgi:hypothetical protein